VLSRGIDVVVVGTEKAPLNWDIDVVVINVDMLIVTADYRVCLPTIGQEGVVSVHVT
jgi:hypothetical protein